MRIVILCLSPSRGGLELYTLEEIRQLTARGHDCHAVVVENGYLLQALKKENISCTVITVKFKRLPLIAAIKLKNLVKEFKADILHFHWVNDLYLAALTKALTNDSFKLVHSRHMNYTRSKKDIVHRWYYKKIDLLLVGTKVLLQQAKQYLPIEANNIQLLYLGTAKPTTDISSCRALFDDDQFTDRKLNLAVFGRIEDGKGQHIAIQAVTKLIAKKKDISLTMIGHTMDQEYQARLVSDISVNQLNEFIRFKGFLENANSYMSCFDVVVLSTHCETFGLVLIEAMRAGVAVIGTNDGGVPEIIEHGTSGCLVEPKNVESMQQAIEKLYGDSDFRRQLASAGKERADDLFSNERHYPKLEAVLSSTLPS